jgi:hypothetical protein
MPECRKQNHNTQRLLTRWIQCHYVSQREVLVARHTDQPNFMITNE